MKYVYGEFAKFLLTGSQTCIWQYIMPDRPCPLIKSSNLYACSLKKKQTLVLF